MLQYVGVASELDTVNILRSAALFGWLSLLAGSACTASDQSHKTGRVEQSVSEQNLHAGISTVSAEERGTAGHSSRLVFHVENRSDKPVSVLTWNTPLEKELSADVFEVSLNGQLMAYQGRKVKRGTPQAEDYIRIPTGGRIETVVDIARYYDMSQSGRYTVLYRPDEIGGVTRLNQQTPVSMEQRSLVLIID